MNTSIANDVETAMTDLVDSLQYDQAKIDNKKYSIHPWGTDESTESSENFDLKQKYRGLRNLGNSKFILSNSSLACYMNSFVQALFMTKIFRFNILSINVPGKILEANKEKSEQQKALKQEQQQVQQDIKAEETPGQEITTAKNPQVQKNVEDQIKRTKLSHFYQFQKLFALLHQSQRNDIYPAFFKAILPEFFRDTNAQQDSSEFGRVFLDQVEGWFKGAGEEDIIKKLFMGEMNASITCQDCQNRVEKVETYLDLGLHFESKEPGLNYDLMELLNRNFGDEEFKDQNAYFCENCQKKSSLAIKSHKPKKFPPVLILNVNRFYFDLATLKRTKILSYVDIPEEIKLTQNTTDIQEELIYDLYAIVVHRVK